MYIAQKIQRIELKKSSDGYRKTYAERNSRQDKKPMIYQYYRKLEKDFNKKNAITFMDKSTSDNKDSASALKKFRCIVCGYIYDEALEKIKFADLPEDWQCPVCGVPKTEFEEV